MLEFLKVRSFLSEKTNVGRKPVNLEHPPLPSKAHSITFGPYRWLNLQGRNIYEKFVQSNDMTLVSVNQHKYTKFNYDLVPQIEWAGKNKENFEATPNLMYMNFGRYVPGTKFETTASIKEWLLSSGRKPRAYFDKIDDNDAGTTNKALYNLISGVDIIGWYFGSGAIKHKDKSMWKSLFPHLQRYSLHVGAGYPTVAKDLFGGEYRNLNEQIAEKIRNEWSIFGKGL